MDLNNIDIVLSKLNEETLEIKETFNTGWKKQWSANAFMLCGTLYVLKKYDDKQVCFQWKRRQSLSCQVAIFHDCYRNTTLIHS
jgi:hypothetical protein